MNDNPYVINSILRAFRVLEAFADDSPSHRFSALQAKLGFNKTTLFRVLASLQKAGVLNKDGQTGEYLLTHRLFRIGNLYRKQLNLYNIAYPVMLNLVEKTEKTSRLAIRRGFEVIYIGEIQSPKAIRIRSRIGDADPCHCSSSGKVLLAFQDKETIDELSKAVVLKRLTPNTIVDLDEMKNQFHDIREKGYAIDNEENEIDISSIAAPIFTYDGKVASSISIVAPSFRMTASSVKDELIQSVHDTASIISQRLGFREN
jgi:DNA-binding IclR family transcriptional regulator